MGYVSLQGKMYAAAVSNGVPGAFRYLGNVPEGGLQFSTDVFTHSESTTGQRLEDLRIPRNKSAKITITLEDFIKDNLALTSGLVAGDFVRTTKPNFSALVVTVSAGTPATLTLGTHNEITSAVHG